MTSSSGSDDASGQPRRRRSARPPEPSEASDSSWADVVGLRGTWQEEAEPPAAEAVNPNRPWWAGGGVQGGSSSASSPFQPGGAMAGGITSDSGSVGPGQAGNGDSANGESRNGDSGFSRGGFFEPVVPPSSAEPGRAAYQAAPYDPSGYQRPDQPEVDQQPRYPPPYEPQSYEPPRYEPPPYEPPPYEPLGHQPPPRQPGYTPPPLERPSFGLPATWDPPTGGLSSLDELTTALPPIPAAPAPLPSPTPPIPPTPPVPPAAVTQAPSPPAAVPDASFGPPTTGSGPPLRPMRVRSRSRGDAGKPVGPAVETAITPPTAAPPPDDAPTSVGIPPVPPAAGDGQNAFNAMLTGPIPTTGKGPRTRGSGARAKSSGGRSSGSRGPATKGLRGLGRSSSGALPAAQAIPVLPASPPIPPAEIPLPVRTASQPSTDRPVVDRSVEQPDVDDDSTTIFPAGLVPRAPGAPDDEDGPIDRPLRRPKEDLGRSRSASTSPRSSDLNHEAPLQPDSMLLPGVPAAAGGRAGRNLPAAIAVGVGLGTLAVVSLFSRPEAFVAVVSVVAVLAVWELAGAMAAKDIMVPVVPLAVGSLGMLVSAFVAGEEGLLVSFTLTGFGVLLWRIIDGVEGAARDVTAGLFVAAYVPLLAGFAILMLADGPKYVVAFILVTVASDIGGYVAGVLAGRTPMAPTISPKKTWEGFAGSVVACLAVGVASVVLLLEGPPLVGLALGGAAVITATLGDLAESLLKRDLNVKDMGNLLPGHGGLMDRLDSLLPTAPVAFLILHMLVAT